VDTVLMDVTNAADCRRVIQRLKPYAIVNNAGFPAVGAVEDVSDKEARAVLETMVIAPMRLARLALPHMRAAGEGRIINISSIYGVATTPLSGWYQAAKHALEGVSDALRMEIANTGVKVVLIEPGGFKTGIWEETEKTARPVQGLPLRQRLQAHAPGLAAEPADHGRAGDGGQGGGQGDRRQEPSRPLPGRL